MTAAIREAGVPAGLSNSAGTFVCNHLMYGVLYHIEREFPNMIGGFMHVPFLHEQVINKKETANLSKDDVVKAIEAAIEAIVDSRNEKTEPKLG
jgi:pyroglutamyl-peptidase